MDDVEIENEIDRLAAEIYNMDWNGVELTPEEGTVVNLVLSQTELACNKVTLMQLLSAYNKGLEDQELAELFENPPDRTIPEDGIIPLAREHLDKQHTGHTVFYTQVVGTSVQVEFYDQKTLTVLTEEFQDDNVTQQFLYCETCRTEVLPQDLGLKTDDWEPRIL